ncbi:MAG: type II toxin-antitoxin system VapC family toxin [Fibromonadales bacterium]|nr:type II toxin-antitoxin system VapC family toxin [Fibromonadales bacterium]
MRYLIDTNIFLFAIQEKDKLNKEVLSIITDYENKIYISSESLKEIILLLRANKIEVPAWKTTMDIFLSAEDFGFTVDYFKREHILALGKIEPVPEHKDPFDHAIMAHAIANKITLISSDTQMQNYTNQGLKFLWNRYK